MAMAAEPAQVASDKTSRVRPRAVARIAEISTRTPTPTSNAVSMLLRFAPVAAPALSASFNGFDGRCQGRQRRRGDKVLQNLPLVAFRLARFALGRDPADHVGEGGK